MHTTAIHATAVQAAAVHAIVTQRAHAEDHPHGKAEAAAQQTSLPRRLSARMASFALAAVLTLAMLAGVHTLAASDSASAPQWAQRSTSRA